MILCFLKHIFLFVIYSIHHVYPYLSLSSIYRLYLEHIMVLLPNGPEPNVVSMHCLELGIHLLLYIFDGRLKLLLPTFWLHLVSKSYQSKILASLKMKNIEKHYIYESTTLDDCFSCFLLYKGLCCCLCRLGALSSVCRWRSSSAIFWFSLKSPRSQEIRRVKTCSENSGVKNKHVLYSY